MARMRKHGRSARSKHGALLALILVMAAGCEDGEDKPRTNVRGSAPPEAAGAKKAGEGSLAEVEGKDLFKDSDFTESEGNRDPFRSYEELFRQRGPAGPSQRVVVMPATDIDDMKLIAIITGIEQPRAMLVDEKGVGWVTTRGDFVGKPEVVRSGGAENLAVTVNWRVDRIRENEVILARDDPSGPNRPPLTKVIPLRDAEDDS